MAVHFHPASAITTNAQDQTQLAHAALSSNSIASVLPSRSALIRDQHIFNIRIPKEISPVTNQKQSGRCWLFATTNLLRLKVAEKYNISSFELSQSYLFYWDKLEKANHFLEIAIATADLPLADRFVQRHFESPVEDGGQWDMAVNLVEKYGIVPKSLYPDSFSSGASRELVAHVATKLRRDALILRSLAQKAGRSSDNEKSDGGEYVTKDDVAAAKTRSLREIQRMITILLGPPPVPTENMTWEFYDADKKFVSVTATPLELAAEVTDPTDESTLGARVGRMFSLSNDPRNEYNRLLSVDRLNNVISGRPVRYVNVSMETLKGGCVAMLRAGLPVFFGCDSGKFSNSKAGVWDVGMYDYENAFSVRLDMAKAARLETGESKMTHAMVITGVHVVDDATEEKEKGKKGKKKEKTVRWRIENSWSDTNGDKGYFVMTDAWMDQFVYQAVVDPAFVDEAVSDVLEQDPLVLPRWDPMGALA